jgi:hypothetical protein
LCGKYSELRANPALVVHQFEGPGPKDRSDGFSLTGPTLGELKCQTHEIYNDKNDKEASNFHGVLLYSCDKLPSVGALLPGGGSSTNK